MDPEPKQIHIVFFPFMAHGHMIPTLDIARLFAARKGVEVTIITTPLNAPTFTRPIENSKKIGGPIINIEIFRFPAKEAGLPEECEFPDPALRPVTIKNFLKATDMLSEQLEEYLDKVRPNCPVAGMFPWATDSATKFNIPTLVFQGTSNFSLCVQEIIRLHEPFKNAVSQDETFVLPCIPHEIELTRSQIPEYLMQEGETEHKRRIKEFKESEKKSYGVIVNSFYELESDYADFYRRELGRRAWNIGPALLSNKSMEDKVQRGQQTSIDEHKCLQWLNSKKPNSVIYICFGSQVIFTDSQLYEIAKALEASGKDFIWIVLSGGNGRSEEWLPEGFEQRMEGKGLIIRGWAPQVLILEHEAIGVFVTHCGWNSTLEAISAGVPMVTWPVFSEQFYNEKLVTQVLKIGVPVGVKVWSRTPSIENIIKQEAIEKALREVMDGKMGEEKRARAKQLKEMALNAIEEGGSSYSQIGALINELRGCHP